MIKKFKSLGSYIEEDQIGKHITYLVKNDIDRDPNLDTNAYLDIVGKQVEIDGEIKMVRTIRNKNQSFGCLDFKKGNIIGIQIL